MAIIMVLIVAVSLSMDAFSLSLAYGTLNFPKKNIMLLSIIVGLYHFFMPILGMHVGNIIISILPIKPSTLVFIVLFFIGIEMIIESLKEDRNIKMLSIIEMIIFGLAVSIDSFTVGLGLEVIYKSPFVSAFIFSISSFVFTYLGLYLGKMINNVIGRVSTIIGGVVLIIIGIFYLF